MRLRECSSIKSGDAEMKFQQGMGYGDGVSSGVSGTVQAEIGFTEG